MKRLLFFSGWLAFLLLALFVGGHALAQGGHTGAYLRIWADDGTYQDYQCQSVSIAESPTLESESTPIPTALPPTATPTSTPTITPTPAPTATPLPLCRGKITEAGTRLRAAPWGTIIDTLQAEDLPVSVGITAKVEDNGWWYQATANGQSVYVYADLVTLVDAAGCPAGVVETAPTNQWGLHLTVGASQDTVIQAILDGLIGSVKGTTGTEPILRAVRSAYPNIFIFYRSLVGGDCPPGWGTADPITVADARWTQQYNAWQQAGILGVADRIEVINECGQPASAWYNAFWLRILEHANAAGICLAIFSDSVGTPEILQFQSRAPVLDDVLANECQPGKYHLVAYHNGGYDTGDWLFGRWKLFLAALGPKYEALRWVFSEYNYSDGRGTVDCGQFWADWKKASAALAGDHRVWAIEIFNVSPASEWMDVEVCL